MSLKPFPALILEIFKYRINVNAFSQFYSRIISFLDNYRSKCDMGIL